MNESVTVPRVAPSTLEDGKVACSPGAETEHSSLVSAPTPSPAVAHTGKHRRRLTDAQLARRRAWGAEWGPRVGASIRAAIKAAA